MPAAESPPPRRRGNGLLASNFVALADVDPRLGAHLLDLLRLADVPAYLEPSLPDRGRSRSPRDRLYVAGSMREQALAVVAAAADEAGGRVIKPDDPHEHRDDLLAGIDTDAEFAALVFGWDDASDAGEADGGAAESELRRVEIELPTPPPELDETEHFETEHYEPPPPPPLPRPSPPTVGAMLLILAGILVIARAGWLGLTSDVGFPLGIILVLSGFGMLVSRLRDGTGDGDSDTDDDGAIV